MRALAVLCSLWLLASAQRTSPPSGCLVVQKGGKYSTVQSAVDALASTTSAACIFIYPGTYNEQVYLPSSLPALTIYGSTPAPSSASSNTVKILSSLSQKNVSSNDLTATLRAHSANLKVYNLNLVNGFGSGSQALAVSAQGTRQGYYACSFSGYQDTVLSEKGSQLFARSKITGAVDFIFGQSGRAWIDKPEIEVVGQGWVTAQGRPDKNGNGWVVINGGKIAGASGVAAGKAYLGRPWREYARVTVQRVQLGSVVRPEGWSVWSQGDERTAGVEFVEFENTGEGAKGARAAFAKKGTGTVTVSEVLGSDYTSWVDVGYL